MNDIPKLQPRKTPEPTRPFVNRLQELQLVQKKMDTGLQGDTISLPVTCFWGPFGMGKSWLLGEIERRWGLSWEQTETTKYRPVPARLDLDQTSIPTLWHDNQLDRIQLIQELWRQLARQLGISSPDLGDVSPEEWANNFAKQLTSWAVNSITPLIILDTVDELVIHDEKTFFWLEEYLVEPLALTNRVLFIFASRGELRRWQRFQVRRRVDSHPLSVFDNTIAGEAIKANPDISKVVYQHTFGHPLANDFLGTILQNQGVNLENEKEVDKKVKQEWVEATLLKVTQKMLQRTPESSKKLARYASVLRWVNIEPLRFLNEKLELIESGGDAHYDKLITGLQAKHILYWNSDKSCYEFDYALRRLLTHFLELSEPDRFQAAHKAAFEFHNKHLLDYPQYLARYVPEWVYHRTMIKENSEIPSFTTWWRKFLAVNKQIPQDAWRELVNTLEPDKELDEPSGYNPDRELKEVMPPAEYEYLISEARKRLN